MRPVIRPRFLLCAAALLALNVEPAIAIDTSRSDVKDFIAHMVDAYAFKKRPLRKLLTSAQSQPLIVEAMNKPAEKAKLWYEYRPIFVTERRIREGTEFWIAHRQALDQAACATVSRLNTWPQYSAWKPTTAA